MQWTEKWSLKKPEIGENDKAFDWAENMDKIDDALLSPEEKEALIGGGETDLHRHDTDVPSALTPGVSSAEGSSEAYARADHVHGLPNFGTSSGTFCQGNDARLLTTTQKSELTGGGYTSLHKHYVDGSDIASGKIPYERLPFGISANNALVLNSPASHEVYFDAQEQYVEYAAASGWRRFRTGASTYPAYKDWGLFPVGFAMFMTATIQATTANGGAWRFALGIYERDTLMFYYVLSSSLLDSGDTGTLSLWADANWNSSNAKATDLWVYTPTSTKVTVMGSQNLGSPFGVLMRSKMSYISFRRA